MSYAVRPLMNPHTHLREGDVLDPLAKMAVLGGARMLGPMPNTLAGLMTAKDVVDYRYQVNGAVAGTGTLVVGIVQMTGSTTKEDIDDCVRSGIVDAKVYPRARTTMSGHGVSYHHRLIDLVRYAGERGVRVHFHPEHPSQHFDNRDAEFAFLPTIDAMMADTNTTIVWEHGTDGRCVPFFEDWAKTGRFYVTLTAHHLVENETGTYGDVGAACKPPYKKEQDRRALVDLVARNYFWVMAGGDDAPHPTNKKHVVGRCACGAYTAPFLLPLYAHALLRRVGLSVFENFTCLNARRLYYPVSQRDTDERLILVEEPFVVPSSYSASSWTIEPFWSGRTIDYRLDAG